MLPRGVRLFRGAKKSLKAAASLACSVAVGVDEVPTMSTRSVAAATCALIVLYARVSLAILYNGAPVVGALLVRSRRVFSSGSSRKKVYVSIIT